MAGMGGRRSVRGWTVGRAAVVVAVAGTVAVGALAAPTAGAASAASTSVTTVVGSGLTARDVLRNADFREGTRHWYPSSGARLDNRPSGTLRALAVSNTSKRTRSMVVRSTVSSLRFAAGTKITVTGQLRASRTGGTLALRAQEHASRPAPARWRTSATRRSSTGWRTFSTTLTIARDDSRISVRALNARAKGKQRMFVRALRVSVVEPPARPGEWIPNVDCVDGTSGWTPSSGARVEATRDGDPGCRVVTGNAGTASATSRTSAPVGVAGSVVHVASQLRSSGVGGPVSMTLEEVASDGTSVQRFAGVPDSTSSWAWAGAKLTTKRSGSRVRVVYRAESAAAGATLEFRSSEVTVGAGTPTTPIPTPTTPAPAPTTPAPTTATPTTPTPTPTTPPPTTPPPADGDATRTCNDLNDPGRRTLAWADEFDGTSLDTSRWNVRDKTSLSFDAAYLTKDAVKVGNGVMTIQGRRRSSPATVSSGLRERWYDTGYIDTIGKASQKYGRWEMRAKLPTAHTMTRGVWPAFWLRGDRTTGEIDIMEAYGGESTQRWNPAGSYTTTLWEDTNLGKQKGEWYAWAHQDWATRSPAASVYSQFHTYGFNWTPDCMQFTLDGQVLSTVRSADVPWAKAAFDSPFNIRLNMQVGSSYWGMPDTAHTKDAFDYVVDSVKVYRMNP